MNRRLSLVGAGVALALAACQSGAPSGAKPPVAPSQAPSHTPSAAPPAPGPTLAFSDATAASGLKFSQFSGRSGRRYYLEPHAGGCAAFDADGDGLTDLYAVDGGPLPGYDGPLRRSNRLFRNKGDGTFEDVTTHAGVAGKGYGFGAFPADYDGDGDEDLLVTNYGNVELFRNKGDGTFEDVTKTSGLKTPGWTTGAAFFDADGDGDLDLYVVHYVQYDVASARGCWRRGQRNHCTPYDFTPEQDQLFENRGDGTFRDVTATAGLVTPNTTGNGNGLGAVVYDFDQDGHPDVYVANDESPKLFYHGQGGLRFEEIGMRIGAATSGDGAMQAGMGIDAGDVDGDGRPDLVVSNFQDEGINDFRQIAPLMFEDRGARSGLSHSAVLSLGFSVLLFDADLDGDRDVYVATGHVWDNIAETQPGVTYAQRDLLGQNDGHGNFTDVGATAGPPFQQETVSRGACLLDADNDGDQDLFVVHLDGPATLLKNVTPRGDRHALGLQFSSPGKNHQALGARVTVRAGGLTQMLQNWRVRGYLSTSERTMRLGLGTAAKADAVEVVFPGGKTVTVNDLAGDRVYVIDEATGQATPLGK